MHQPPIFQEDRVDVMQNLMRAHPFATIVSNATGVLTAEHVPLVLHRDEGERGLLRGHIAFSNPLYQKSDGPIDVLTIFQGPQAYISPSLYASKYEHGKVVPTWNYAVVHARGTLTFTREVPWLMRHLHDLTSQQENLLPDPWAVDDAPADYIAKQLRGLVGFEIKILGYAGTWKVSQNKTSADRKGVQKGLVVSDVTGEKEVAALVQERSRN